MAKKGITHLEFTTQEGPKGDERDTLKCSVYINPDEGELVIMIEDVEIVGVLLRDTDTLAGFYFPRDRIKVLDEPGEESQAIWILN